MEKEKRNLKLGIVGMLLFILICIGYSYAMYRADVKIEKKTETSIQTLDTGLIYTGGTDDDGRAEIDVENVMPGDKFAKTFTVENITDKALWYNIYMENIENDYNEDLVYTLYEVDSTYQNIIRTVVEETKLPDTTINNENKKAYLETKIDIEAQPKVQYYKLVIEYKYDSEHEQEIIEGKFEGTVGIDVNEIENDDDPKYALTINPNGGTYQGKTTNTTVQLKEDATYNLQTPTRSGYTFTGWTSNVDGVLNNNVVTMPGSAVTLTANWEESSEPQPTTYTLTINPNGGIYNNTTDNTVSELETGTVVNLLTPTKEGYTFAGWTSVPQTALSGTIVTITDSDVTVTAQWTEESIDPQDSVAMINRTGTEYETIQAAEDAAIANDTITILKDTEEDFTNNKTIRLNLNQKTVTGKLSNLSSGNITVVDGVLQNQDDYTIINNGTLTLGEDDGNISRDSVQIVDIDGIHNAIKQDGTMNFYDGYVEGYIAIEGNVDRVPDPIMVEITLHTYYPFIDRNQTKDCQKAYIDDDISRAIVKTVTGGEVLYYNLQDAINTSEITGYTIYAIKDFETPYLLSIDEEKSIKIDIDGHNVNISNVLTNNGTLELTNSQTTGRIQTSFAMVNNNILTTNNIKMTSENDLSIINNSGMLTGTNANIIGHGGYAVESSGVINLGENSYLKSDSFLGLHLSGTASVENGIIDGTSIDGNVTINGGTFRNNPDVTALGIKYGYAIIINSGSLTVNDAIVTSANGGVYVERYSNVSIVINDINMTTTNYGFELESFGSLTINDGTFKNDTYAIVHYAKSVVVNGGTFTSTNGGGIDGENISFIDGTINVPNGTGIILDRGSITGGNITAKVGIQVSDSSSRTVPVENVIINAITGIEIYNYGDGAGMRVALSSGTINATEIGVHIRPAYNASCRSSDKERCRYDALNMTGGTITAGQYGIKNDVEYVNAKITDGTITSDEYAAYLPEGRIVLGTNDGNVSTTIPVLVGEYYGIYIPQDSNGEIAFYDGVVKGITDSYLGSITLIATGMEMSADLETIGEKTYKTAFLAEQKEFVQVGNAKFDSLLDAVSACGSSGTMKLIRTPDTQTDAITIPTNANITFDLNGFTYSTTKPFTNNGTLTIVDTSENHDGVLSTPEDITLITNARGKDLIINSGIITRVNTTTNSNIGAINNNGNITLNGGTINSKFAAIRNMYDRASINITGGIINSDGVYQRSNYTSYYASIMGYSSNAPVTISGGTINATIGVSAYKLTMTGGTINATKYGLESPNGTLSGGTITAGEYGVYINSATVLTIEDNNSIYIKGDTAGIYVKTGTLNLGTKDGNVKNSPVILGGTYGIEKESGNIKFYDGVLKGTTKGYTNVIDEIEVGNLIEDGVDGDYKTSYLVSQQNFLDVGGEKYNSITTAIEAITESGTIIMERTPGIQQQICDIPAGKNITFDLNGQTYNTTQKCTVEGTLTLKDDSAEQTGHYKTDQSNLLFETIDNGVLNIKSGTYEKSIASNSEVIINNGNGHLTIDGGTITSLYQVITNYGYMTLNDGTIKMLPGGATGNTTKTHKIVYNVADTYTNRDGGKLTINGGSIESTKTVRGIEGTNVTINGGTVSTDWIGIYGADNTINGGTIRGGQSSGIYSTSGNLDMTGGYIYGGYYGIQIATNYSYSTIDIIITGGKVEGANTAINNTLSRVHIVIGEDDGTLLDESNGGPVIIGASKGIESQWDYEENSVRLYDGAVKGQVYPVGTYSASTKGEFTHIANGATLVEDTEVIGGKTYIRDYLVPTGPIVTDGTTPYTSLKDAIENASDGATLTFLDNVTAYDDLSIDKNLTIDMAGYNLNISRTIIIDNNDDDPDNDASVKITNSSPTGQSTITITVIEPLINNTENMEIENIVLNGTTKGVTSNRSTNIINNNKMKLTNVSSNLMLENAKSTSEVELKDCNISSQTQYSTTTYAIKNIGTMSIDGGDFGIVYDDTTLTSEIDNTNTISLIMNKASNFTLNNCGIKDINNTKAGGQVTINNSTLKSLINAGSTTMNNVNLIDDARYTSKKTFISNTGTIDIEDFDMTVNNEINGSNPMYGIYNNNANASIVCNDCDIDMTNNYGSSSTTYGIYNNNGTITLSTGSISVDSKTAYGIYIANGSVTIGTPEDPSSPNYGTPQATVSTSDPSISATGTTTGIGVKRTNGAFNFYDGIIYGSTDPKPDATTITERYFTAYTNSNNRCYLVYSGE